MDAPFQILAQTLELHGSSIMCRNLVSNNSGNFQGVDAQVFEMLPVLFYFLTTPE
jgi:hypothetical protein